MWSWRSARISRPTDHLNNLYVKSQWQQVPLSTFTAFGTAHIQSAPLAIGHQGQFPSATVVSFNLATRQPLGDAVKAIEQASSSDIGMPASIDAELPGNGAAFQTSLAIEPLLILAALVMIYIVLGVLYESYIHPLTISRPSPRRGGSAARADFTRMDFSVIALIGIILLIGIVKKNAIMMIDFALQAEREEGKPPEEAIFEACLLRFRPIMMTTMAALLGGLPLALGGGVGAELRMPLGITIVGGLLFRSCSRSYTTPVIYLYFDKLARRMKPREIKTS